jgi:hypothetical protein
MMLTTCPCAAVSSGQNRRDSRTAPKNFSANPSAHASSGIARKSPALVALVDAGEQLLAARQRAQVARDRHRLRSPGTRHGLGRLGQIGRRRRGEHAARPLARERGGDRPADAVAGAGDDDDLALKFSRHVPSPFEFFVRS